MAVLFTQLKVIAIFEHNISQGSVTTRLRCSGIFYNCIARNVTGKSVGERILKNGQHLAKLKAKIEWFHFLVLCIHGVS